MALARRSLKVASRMSPTAIGYIGRGPVRELPAVGRPGPCLHRRPPFVPTTGRPCDQLGGALRPTGGRRHRAAGPCDQPGRLRACRTLRPTGCLARPRPGRGCGASPAGGCGGGQAAPGTGHDGGVAAGAPGSLRAFRSLRFGHSNNLLQGLAGGPEPSQECYRPGLAIDRRRLSTGTASAGVLACRRENLFGGVKDGLG